MNRLQGNIDYGKDRIGNLFLKLLIPTMMSQFFIAVLNVVDGIVVGRGIGSDAIAAVNVASPIFLAGSSTALLFASGVSIIAAIQLAKNKGKAANVIMTQSMTVATAFLLLFGFLICLFAEPLCYLLGGSERLCPYVVDYIRWVSPTPMLIGISMISEFMIRLDGSPKYAMSCSIVAAAINIILDLVFVFPMKMGIMGAALATSIATAGSAAMSLLYLFNFSGTLHFYRLEFSRKVIRDTARNTLKMMEVGMPSFIGEFAIISMLVTGNHMFISRLGEDGVAAFSVCCYLFPLVFMFGNAIAQAQMPIISYNYGLGNESRVRKTFRLSMISGLSLGVIMTILGIAFSSPVATLFLGHSGTPCELTAYGLPLFSSAFIFFNVNLVLIGGFQCIEYTSSSIFFMLLRGVILIVPAFIFLPRIIGDDGLWLAVPVSEFLTLVCISVRCLLLKKKDVL